MFNQYYFPEVHNPRWLDDALRKGWFRMGQSVFTNQFITFDNKIYRTVWLRHCLQNYTSTKTINNLHKRNKNFRAEFTAYHVTEAHHQLFETYRNAMPFSTCESIPDLLFSFINAANEDVFNTHQINLYDGDTLIGCSFFDFGFNSVEGISSFYNPAYAQYSIGRYLIYLQIEVCINNKIKYYYPGYFVPGYAHLDYKLAIGTHCLEFFENETASWKAIENYIPETIPLQLKKVLDQL
jgi:leucyl-tRNA---protein transferase